MDGEGQLRGNMLYAYTVEGTDRDSSGRVTAVRGRHARVGCLSPALAKRMRDNGVPENTLLRLFPEIQWKGGE